jgi:hypothetical protein
LRAIVLGHDQIPRLEQLYRHLAQRRADERAFCKPGFPK